MKLREEKNISLSIKHESNKVQEKFHNEISELSTKLGVQLQCYEQQKRNDSDLLYEKEKEINQLIFKHNCINKEYEILLNKQEDSKMRFESLNKDYESTKDTLFVRNEDLRVKLRETENLLNINVNEFSSFKNNSENTMLRTEQSLIVVNSD